MSGDDRVVGIEFDNTSFERKLAQTIESLDKLQTTLEKQNGKKALEDLSTAGSKFNVQNITDGIEGISAKFLAMSTIGITALANIAGKAVEAGITIAKSLTLDNVIAGFREYETNMNSIQTIMTNTRKDGTTLNQVNDALKTLNEYSDQTIYNFSEMARNIGTFTAAGIDLDTSTSAIKGIANLAAASGSDANQAATAMYQLSQALASGTVKLMDWNSVVNAGMGGEMFQEALFNAGKLKGTLEGVGADQTFDQWKAAGNTFRDSLESGWITADVLTTTLQGFTGDLTQAQIMAMGYTAAQAEEIFAMGQSAKDAATQVKTFTQLVGTVKESIGSGWSESFKIIVGDFDQARGLFTGINNAIGGIIKDGADKRNKLLQGWADLNGRAMLIDGIVQGFQAIANVLKPIKQAFSNIFPPVTAQTLADLTEKFRDFMAMLQPSTSTVLRLQRIFEGIFAVFEIGWTVVKEIGGAFKTLFDELNSGGAIGEGKILKFFAEIGDKLVALNKMLVEGGGIADFFDKIDSAIKNPKKALEDFIEFLSGLGSGNVGAVFDAIAGALERVLPFISKARDLFGELKDKVVDFISGIDFGGLDIGKKFGDTPGVVDRVSTRFDMLKDVVKDVAGFFKSVGSGIGDALGKIAPVLEEIYDHIRDWLSSLGGKLADAIGEGDFDKVIDIVNVGLLGGIVAILRKFLKGGIEFDFGGGFFKGISDTFDQLGDTLKAMETKVKADALIRIAIALAILTASLVVLSLIDSAALTKALVAMAVGFGQLAAMLAILDKIAAETSPTKLIALSVSLILIAGAMFILSISMKLLSTLSWEEIAKGFVGVIGLLGALIVVSKNLDVTDMIKAGAGILLLAGGLLILGLAMKIFATLAWEEMAKGLVGVTVGLAGIGLAMQQMPEISPKDGVALILIAGALALLGLALKTFAALSWGEMAKGFTGVGAGLLLIAGAMHLMPKDMLVTAAGLLIVSAALLLIAKAIKEFGGMSWAEIGTGLAVMAAALIILAVAAHAMSGAILGAAAIGILAVSLVLLVGVLKTLSLLSIEEIAIGLGAIAAVFLVLGAAAFLLQPVIPALFLLAIALGLIGLAFVLFGAGVAMAGAGFAALAKAGDAGIKVFIKLLDAIIAKIPEFIASLATGVLDMIGVFVAAIPELAAAVVTIVTALLQAVQDLVPEIVATIIVIVQGLLTAIREIFPDVVATGYALLLALLQGIQDNIGELVTTVVGIITAFIDAISANLSQITDSAVNLLLTFLQGIADRITDVTAAAVNIIVTLAKGISDNVQEMVAAATTIITDFLGEIAGSATKIISAGTQVITDIITGLGNAAEDIVTAGGDAIISFLDGIAGKTVDIIEAGFDIIIDMLNGIENAIRENDQELIDAGWGVIDAIIDGMMNGFTDLAGKVYRKADEIANEIIRKLTHPWEIFSPSHVTRRLAGYLMEGIVVGMEDEEASIMRTATGIGEDVVASLTNTMSLIPDILDNMNEFNPTITPVLDLTGVKREAQNLSGMLDSAPLSVSASVNQARLISADASAQAESGSFGTVKASEVKFEQNINAPEALSTADIYRQTRNLVALAKEELAIL